MKIKSFESGKIEAEDLALLLGLSLGLGIVVHEAFFLVAGAIAAGALTAAAVHAVREHGAPHRLAPHQR